MRRARLCGGPRVTPSHTRLPAPVEPRFLRSSRYRTRCRRRPGRTPRRPGRAGEVESPSTTSWFVSRRTFRPFPTVQHRMHLRTCTTVRSGRRRAEPYGEEGYRRGRVAGSCPDPLRRRRDARNSTNRIRIVVVGCAVLVPNLARGVPLALLGDQPPKHVAPRAAASVRAAGSFARPDLGERELQRTQRESGLGHLPKLELTAGASTSVPDPPVRRRTSRRPPRSAPPSASDIAASATTSIPAHASIPQNPLPLSPRRIHRRSTRLLRRSSSLGASARRSTRARGSRPATRVASGRRSTSAAASPPPVPRPAHREPTEDVPGPAADPAGTAAALGRHGVDVVPGGRADDVEEELSRARTRLSRTRSRASRISASSVRASFSQNFPKLRVSSRSRASLLARVVGVHLVRTRRRQRRVVVEAKQGRDREVWGVRAGALSLEQLPNMHPKAHTSIAPVYLPRT